VGAVLVLRDAHHPRLLGLVYLSTVLGGWVADRLLGMERTVFYGGVVVMCGHIALALLPGLTGVAVGLVLIALGSVGLIVWVLAPRISRLMEGVH
jgi:dipeptide/tripeptide permease